MLNFRRGYKLLNLSRVLGFGVHLDGIYFGETHVANLLIDTNLKPTVEKLKYPFSYNRQIPLFYSTRLIHSNPDVLLSKFSSVIDENECDNSRDDEFSGEDDEIEAGKWGLKDEKSNHDVGVLLEILRGIGSRNIPFEGERSRDKPGLMSASEVTKKLNQCGINLTSEVVLEVLSRIRNDWEVAYMFFLWAGKQPEYAHSVREYHSMITILAKRRKFDTAWSLIEEMRRGGFVNTNTLLIMIRRYCAVHDVAGAVNTFHAFKRFDFAVGVEEFHKLLSALSRYKNVQDAEHLLFSNKNTFPFNTKSFNIILNGWCNVIGNPVEVRRFWRLMIELGIKLDVVSYSSMISSYSKWNRLKEVLKLFNKMKELGIDPDRKVYNAVTYALAKGGRVNEALNLLGTMEDKGIAPNNVTFNSLIKPLCKAQKRDEAQKVFDEMLSRGLQPTVRTFHAFMHIQRTGEEIFMLLDKMKEFGCYPNKDTSLLLISKFCRWRQLDVVFKLWDQITENGWNDDKDSYITLIHGLFWNGKLEEAHKLYSEMKEKSLLPDAKTDELIQTWLSNKQMAETESKIINSEGGLMDIVHVPAKAKGIVSKVHKGGDAREQPGFRKVVRERGFSVWKR